MFASVASHDLQEPLRTITSDVELLAYSRVGKRAKPFAPVRMDAVLDQTHDGMKKTVAESDTTISRDELPEVQGDDVQLAQLFHNLIANPVKFRKKECTLPNQRYN